MDDDEHEAAGTPRRLRVFNLGFLRNPRLSRIMSLAGYRPRIGLPRPGDAIGIWGAGPTAWRGRAIAERGGHPIVTIEDAFLRSVLPGRAKGRIAARGPIGLLIDPDGLHFDPGRPSRLVRLIAQPDPAMLDAAPEALERLRAADLSKYNHHDPALAPPPSGFVLVVDQTRGDASLLGAGRAIFVQMLQAARDENPGRRIVIRTHPETAAGLRAGHLGRADLRAGDLICDGPVSPWRLVQAADAVYAVSSQLGYEALLAGHRPRLFGQPFYAGWGLSMDEHPLPRRGTATPQALFAASHLQGPTWYDPCRDRLTDLHGAIDQIEAEARAFRQDRHGHLAHGMRLWKRPFLAREFGEVRPLRHARHPSDQVTLAWASKADATPQAIRVEDGFLRSRGLGAALTPPLSVVADDMGIYFDPTAPSRLEALIAAGPPPGGRARAHRLIAALIDGRVTKYNLSAPTDLPPRDGRRRIMVPGQVEDDASILKGAGTERTNLAALEHARAKNPDAWIVYKPHPDVEAGLRPGLIAPADLSRLADHVARNADPVALIAAVDEVWTITSTLGFEALLRGCPVTTLGAPFYAGWGLTRDLGRVPERRRARPDLAALVHACLIAYPRYRDPVTGLPCPVEVALDRLRDGQTGQPPALRILAKAQGALAGQAWIWRR
ncbi:capsular polysaccharide biosynthesis protein [Paracoccus sp. 1_MG-2023]|uniref:capsular polysaccharide biosynthesis protein n=1 Tax=unclassified Paracoccus (in: a-proteobacteria) TaxID=2688777 RepID=UPI001C08392D|nr:MULTISPECIES: capsular polysaccharide biosynthesis protein [unclassified Paracoccus (in: a-proteobacteria)]MBU2957474.1 capsular polysaccharide biosynthesis protein [Paracoccus sp. C2R09]MDO6669672.1 capsular polysaccharide biosynthesis protein [Paracoccus sp. 1_MG-2023]